MAQLLHLVDSRWQALVEGLKTDTIRLDEGDVETGFLVYESSPSLDRHEVVYVTSVTRDVPLREVLTLTNDPGHRRDESTLLTQMRAHYPAIMLDTPIDYIQHLTPTETREHYPDDVERILSTFS